MKELLIMAKSLGGGGSEVALIELINALPEEAYNIRIRRIPPTPVSMTVCWNCVPRLPAQAPA